LFGKTGAGKPVIVADLLAQIRQVEREIETIATETAPKSAPQISEAHAPE
jgi:hypothetical protein